MKTSKSSPSWQLIELSAPNLPGPVESIAALSIPYIANANRLQTLSIYLAHTPSTQALVGTPVTSLPTSTNDTISPRWQVHVHGGAWRDPNLTASSIEAAAAYTFSKANLFDETKLFGIASLNYTVSPFPSVPSWLPTKPYDPDRDAHTDAAREARHPQHLRDVLSGFALLRGLGLTDGSFILTGHSAGACLAMQSALQDPSFFGLGEDMQGMPCPAAVVGLNGLYDLPGLVYALGETHVQLSDEYRSILSQAFGWDEEVWVKASPEGFDAEGIREKVGKGRAPSLVVLDQSKGDGLVPMNQMERMVTKLEKVEGLRTVRGKRCEGAHAAPWEGGMIIWETVKDVLTMLEKGS